ncbi:MAG: CBS domain-containing protein [Rhodocyclaceae bacterium]|jgi:CBS-domain-containing membrane protein|nr:CBS domain-containing protein [Rhodocyclaceae bacterium]
MVREQYKALPQARLEQCASYFQVEAPPLRSVLLDSPALEVMTDLKRVQAVTIGPDATLAAVSRAMLRNTVRSLLVADEKRCILGIITSTDLLGEKPMHIVGERGVRYEEVLARDIMTPRERLEAITFRAVQNAEVGHVVATLKETGRQHALVIDEDDFGRQMIRGIFSVSRISRQLGTLINATQIATTFAEIEAAIAH